MNPLARLSPALYAALNGLAVAGVPVPVYEHQAPGEAWFFVLLAAPAILSSGGRPACRSWDCQAVVEVTTRFPTGALSADPADEVADQVLQRLDGVALALPEHWQCMPGQVHAADAGAPATDAGAPYRVQRRLTLRWQVYHHAPAPVAPDAPVAVAPVRESAGWLARLRAYFEFTP